MPRRVDWVKRLSVAINERQTRPFSWGGHDCCRAPCALIEAMTGADPSQPLAGYKTARGAAGKLRVKAPAGTPRERRLQAVVEALAADNGFPEIPVTRAQRGDLVLIEVETGDGRIEDALALIDLSGVQAITASHVGGWAKLPSLDAHRAWRIG